MSPACRFDVVMHRAPHRAIDLVIERGFRIELASHRSRHRARLPHRARIRFEQPSIGRLRPRPLSTPGLWHLASRSASWPGVAPLFDPCLAAGFGLWWPLVLRWPGFRWPPSVSASARFRPPQLPAVSGFPFPTFFATGRRVFFGRFWPLNRFLPRFCV